MHGSPRGLQLRGGEPGAEEHGGNLLYASGGHWSGLSGVKPGKGMCCGMTPGQAGRDLGALKGTSRGADEWQQTQGVTW